MAAGSMEVKGQSKERNTCIDEVKEIFMLLQRGQEVTHAFLGVAAKSVPDEEEKMEAVKPALMADLFDTLKSTKAMAQMLVDDLETLRGYF